MKELKKSTETLGQEAKPSQDKGPETCGKTAMDAQTDSLLDTEEAMAYLKTTRPTFSRWLKTGKLKGMKMGRQWRFRREELERFLAGGSQKIEAVANTAPVIGELAERLKSLGVAPWPPADRDEERISLIVEGIVILGAKLRASDIHITPHPNENGASGSKIALRYRIDGCLQPMLTIDGRLLNSLSDGFKRLANCDVNERLLPQDGRSLMKLSGSFLGTGKEGEISLDLRINFLPAAMGEAITIRILDTGMCLPKLQNMGFDPADVSRISEALKKPSGLIVFSGPSGSGKTTGIYACMQELENDKGIKVISVENPVEYILPSVTQVPVSQAQGGTVKYYLRAIMRSDPDVVVLTELRYKDEWDMLQTIALTGHLAICSLHTNSCIGSIKRLFDIGAEKCFLSDTLKLLVSQRLLRCLCPECSVKASPSKEELKKAATIAGMGGIEFSSLPEEYRKAVGCPKCAMTGYKGRTAIGETMEITPDIVDAFQKGKDYDEIQRLAIESGMTTLAADAIRRFARGQTSLQEALSFAK